MCKKYSVLHTWTERTMCSAALYLATVFLSAVIVQLSQVSELQNSNKCDNPDLRGGDISGCSRDSVLTEWI